MLHPSKMPEKLIELGIPPHMHEGIIAYIVEGRPTGHFLKAVFSSDFMEMCRRADEENSRVFWEYGLFLYNYAPAGCYGSATHVVDWINHKGLKFEYPKEPDPRD